MLIDLIKANRSCRGYDRSRKVTREELLQIVDAARLCPSSVNAQPLKYYLAHSPDIVAAIQRLHGMEYGVENVPGGVEFWFDVKKSGETKTE